LQLLDLKVISKEKKFKPRTKLKKHEYYLFIHSLLHLIKNGKKNLKPSIFPVAQDKNLGISLIPIILSLYIPNPVSFSLKICISATIIPFQPTITSLQITAKASYLTRLFSPQALIQFISHTAVDKSQWITNCNTCRQSNIIQC